MRKWLSFVMTVSFMLGMASIASAAPAQELNGIAGGANTLLESAADVFQDQGGSSMKVTQSEVAAAGSTEERSLTISLLDGTTNRDLSAYSGIRFWVKNTAANALYVRTQFDILSRARTLNGMPYYLESAVDGNITERKFAAPEVNGAWPESWSIPASFEGFVYIPFTSLDCWGTAPDITKAAKMYFWIRSVDLGTGALYFDSIGAYDGDTALYNFEQTLSTSILTAQANTTITYTDAIAQDGKSIMATYTGTANTSAGSFNLDLKTANATNRSVTNITGIRFWAKVTSGAGSTGTGMYLVPRYNFPSHSHYDIAASQTAPYYLVQQSAATSYTLQKNTAIDAFSKMMFLPDNFEGWVYLPFSINALRSGGTYLTNPMLATLKLAVGQAVGRNLYVDSFGFYTGTTVPTQDEQPLILYSFTSGATEYMRTLGAQTRIGVMDSSKTDLRFVTSISTEILNRYQVVEMGTMFARVDTLGNTALTLDTVSQQGRVPATYLNNTMSFTSAYQAQTGRTDEYYTYTAVVWSISPDSATVDLAARSYVIYQDDDGQTHTAYGNTIVRSAADGMPS